MWSKIAFFATLFPSQPSLSTSDSRFKIPDPQKTSWTQGGRIQDSRSQKNFLNPKAFSLEFWILISLESWIQRGWIEEVFSEPWILNLESKQVGLKKFFLSLESWILNLQSKQVGLKKFFLSLESWILNAKRLDWRSFFWALNLEAWIQILRKISHQKLQFLAIYFKWSACLPRTFLEKTCLSCKREF